MQTLPLKPKDCRPDRWDSGSL